MSLETKKPPLNELRYHSRQDESRRNSTGGRSSPDVNCPICLGKIEDKAFADRCYHCFCKTCLVEWSKVKAECPVCRQSFRKIIFNVKAMDDYEELPVESRVDSSFSVWTNMDGVPRLLFPNSSSFRYPTTLTPLRRRVLEFQHYVERHQPQPNPSYHRLAVVISSPGSQRRTSISTTTHTHVEEVINIANDDETDVFPPPKGTSAFRRYIYNSDLWVLANGNGDKTRYRESSATFYQANPACTHRLLPWLNREFVAILDNPYECDIILPIVMRSILQCNIVSKEFRRIIEPYTSHRTDHFIHEFYNFARSCFDMEAYSRIAVYVPKPRAEIVTIPNVPSSARPHFPYELSSSSSSSSSDSEDSSSIIVVDSPSPKSPKSCAGTSSPTTDQEIEEAIGSVQFTVAQETNPANDDIKVTIIDDFENPQPGPSGLSMSRSFKCITESDEESDIDVGGNEVHQTIWNPFFDRSGQSDDSIEIVGFRKPLHERTPEVIELSSNAEDEGEMKDQDGKKEKRLTKKKKHKHKHRAHKRHRSRSSSPRGHKKHKRSKKKRHASSRSRSRSRSRSWSRGRSRSHSCSPATTRCCSSSSNSSCNGSVVKDGKSSGEKEDNRTPKKRQLPSIIVPVASSTPVSGSEGSSSRCPSLF